MKQLLVIAVLLIGMIGTAQTQETIEYSLGLSIDPKMAIEGPYADKSNDIGTTLNAEIRLGVEKSNWVWNIPGRAQIMVEIHPAINYTKVTWLSLDLPINIIKNFKGYVGPEISTIYRIDNTAHWSNPSNFRKHKNSLLRYGYNIELQYHIPKSYVHLSLNYNAFQSEGGFDIEGGREDVMAGIVLKV